MSSSIKQIMSNAGTTQFLGTRRAPDISRRQPFDQRPLTRKQERAQRKHVQRQQGTSG